MAKVNMTKLIDGPRFGRDGSARAFLKWFYVTLTTKLPREVFTAKLDEGGDVVFDIEMKLDGHEVDPSETLIRWCEAIDREIQTKATEIVSRKIARIMDEHEKSLRMLAGKLLDDAGVPKELQTALRVEEDEYGC